MSQRAGIIVRDKLPDGWVLDRTERSSFGLAYWFKGPLNGREAYAVVPTGHQAEAQEGSPLMRLIIDKANSHIDDLLRREAVL